jgi:uncharacterized membrane protein
MGSKIVISDLFGGGWETFKRNWAAAVLGMLVALGIIGFFNALPTMCDLLRVVFEAWMKNSGASPERALIVTLVFTAGHIALQILSALANCWISAGIAQFYLRFARNPESGSLGDLFILDSRAFKVILFQFLMGLIAMAAVLFVAVFCGLLYFAVKNQDTIVQVSVLGLFLLTAGLACVVFLTILQIMLSQSVFLIVDRSLGPVDAVRESVRIMSGNKLDYFLLTLVAGFAALAGTLLTCGIGALVMLPLLNIILAKVYLRLTDEASPAPLAHETAPAG